jgi:outer membrane immunogenic protein
MKKFLVAASVIALTSASASSADLGSHPYPARPAIYVDGSWDGFYIGANGGAAASTNCWRNTVFLGVATVPSVAEGCNSAAGATVGGQIGYRWQMASWVFGVEAQGNWADLSASNPSNILSGAITNVSKTDAVGLFTGQVGYTWNDFLLYVKGGAAMTSDTFRGRVTATGSALDTAGETRWGAVAGIGGEYGFAPNWSVALEWDHFFMGDRNVGLISVAVPGLAFRTDSIHQDFDMVTARINYRWGGGPIIARY